MHSAVMACLGTSGPAGARATLLTSDGAPPVTRADLRRPSNPLDAGLIGANSPLAAHFIHRYSDQRSRPPPRQARCRPGFVRLDIIPLPGPFAQQQVLTLIDKNAASTMLYSRIHDIAFAHYPKTAGHSLVEWFRSVFPDASFVETPARYDVSHLPVRDSLIRLGLVAAPAEALRNPLSRLLLRVTGLPRAGRIGGRCPTRIIGVVREPLEMLVSLYEYWRAFPFVVEPEEAFIVSARVGTFREFLEIGVVQRVLWNYDACFDVGGPAWPTTRLIDFRHLDAGLVTVCRELGIRSEGALPRRNIGPQHGRTLASYRDAAGPLLAEVHRHFHWYYEQGDTTLIR